jgi:hypothetical protein
VKERRRLVEESKNDWACTLLESSNEDRPESGACDRALAGLGLGLGVALAATTTTTAATAASSVAGGAADVAPSVGSAAAKGGAILILKWTAGAVVAGAVALGSIRYVAGPTHEAQPRVAPPSVAAPRSPRARSATQPIVGEAPSPESGSAVVSQPVVGVAPPGSHATPAATNDNTGNDNPGLDPPPPRAAGDWVEVAPVTPQLEALGAIRATLARGDASGALVLIDDFAARYPSSPMAEEALVLRIDALSLAGRRSDAATLGESFLRKYPTSAYGERVRARLKSP